MKKQTNRILVSLLIIGYISLGFGYSVNLPHNKQNTFARYTLPKNFAEYRQTKTAKCTGVTANDVLNQINGFPKPLKDQFRNGKITFAFDAQAKTLIFKGYIDGNGNNLRLLINGFDKYRGENCLRVVSFEGSMPGTYFEWRADSDSPVPTPSTDCDVSDVIKRVFGDQVGTTFTYDYDRTSRILEFRGHFGDAPGRGRFNSLTAQLQKYMNNGCLAKIVFAPEELTKGKTSAQLQDFTEEGCKTKAEFSITKIAFVPKIKAMEALLLNRGFEWQICELPSGCECAGQCQPCPC